MKSYIYGIAVLLVLVAQTQASITVNVTYTGDNILGAFYQDGSSPTSITLGGNAGDWQVADTATLTLDLNDTYQLIFEVKNQIDAADPLGPGNPAAFLAQISGNDVHGQLLTSGLPSSVSVTWEYAFADLTQPPPTNFNLLTWYPATEWGNNGGSNIWTSVHGGPISGISTSAQWIWAGVNFEDLADPIKDPNLEYNNLWIKGVINTIPEPASILIWSLFGLGTMFGLRVWRRRGIAVPATPTRQPWSDESRMAIHQMIERGYRR
jgi:hypothetical protein